MAKKKRYKTKRQKKQNVRIGKFTTFVEDNAGKRHIVDVQENAMMHVDLTDSFANDFVLIKE